MSGDGSDGTFVANTSRSVRSHRFSGWGPARCPICIPPTPVPRWASRTLRAICSRPIGIAPMARPRCWLQILPRELYLRPAIDVVLTMRSSIRPAESISWELASIAPHGAGFCHPIRSVLVPIRISMHMSEPGQPPMRIRAAYRRSKTRPQKRRQQFLAVHELNEYSHVRFLGGTISGSPEPSARHRKRNSHKRPWTRKHSSYITLRCC